MSDQPAAQFKVVYSGKILAELKQLKEKANASRMAVSYVLDLQTIQAQMSREPVSWGEFEYELRHLGLKVYHRVFGMLSIHYAVDEARRLVFPTRIVPLPSHPLGQ